MSKEVSFEHLNAFLDDQLDARERELVFRAIKDDPDLSREACALRSLQDMVRHAYRQTSEPAPAQPLHRERRPLWMTAAAAALFLLIGIGLGWLVHGWTPQDPAVVLQLADRGAEADVPPGVILHLSSNDPRKIDTTLRKTEALLERFRREHRQVRVEVIVNSGGLDLLRADTSPAAARIRALVTRYNNVSFLACQRAIQRLKYEKGIEARLLAEALVAPSALNQILSRLQQGWTYIQI